MWITGYSPLHFGILSNSAELGTHDHGLMPRVRHFRWVAYNSSKYILHFYDNGPPHGTKAKPPSGGFAVPPPPKHVPKPWDQFQITRTLRCATGITVKATIRIPRMPRLVLSSTNPARSHITRPTEEVHRPSLRPAQRARSSD